MFPSNFQNVPGAVPQQSQAALGQTPAQVNLQGAWKNVQQVLPTPHLRQQQGNTMVGNHLTVGPGAAAAAAANGQLVQPAAQALLKHPMQGSVNLNSSMRNYTQQATSHLARQGVMQSVSGLPGNPQGQILPGGVVQRVGSTPVTMANQHLWHRGTGQGQIHRVQHQATSQIQPVQAPSHSNQAYVAMQGYPNIPIQQRHMVQMGRSGGSQVLGNSSVARGVAQQYHAANQMPQHHLLKYPHGLGGGQVVDNTGRPLQIASSGMQIVMPGQGGEGVHSGMVQVPPRASGTVALGQNAQMSRHTGGMQAPATGRVVTGSTAPVVNMPLQNGFTHTQLSVLRQQILAFKRIKKGEWNLPPEVLAQIKPVPLQPQVARPVPMTMHAPSYQQNGPIVGRQVGGQPSTYPTHSGVHRGHSVQSLEQKVSEPQPRVPLVRRFQSALCTLTDGSGVGAVKGQGAAQSGGGGFQVDWDVCGLMSREYEAVMSRKRKRTVVELEEKLKGKTVPGFGVGKNGEHGRGALMVKLRQAKLANMQRALRQTVEQTQTEIMKLNERTYRKFVRDCNRHRFEMFKQSEKARTDKAQERAQTAKRMKVSILERAATLKDFRIVRNKGILRTHERLARRHSKLKDDDRVKRLEALKANDFEGYQALLREQSGPVTAGERYAVISRFLTDTEEYLNRLAAKVATVKLNQEASEAAAQAIAEARDQGLSEEEVQMAAREAAQEVAASSELVRRSQNFGEDAQSRYYSLAHSVEEQVLRQPSLLRPPAGASLREYQMVGLQWMVSLYNNRLNGILADEMGLGKTVQVMALIAYLMENKGNYGPHLIIVPNAVIVNWRSELSQWLPSVRCVYYVGHKEERAKKYQQDVQAMQFNVLVTTYEFIMRDRAKLSKIQWKYIVIDEAQRMKDRQSKLAKDLDRFTASRRLLLTGTPLQNELRELWSLLNLLLPEVFDDKKSFTEWFGDALGQGMQPDQEGDAEWLEMEKRVVVIHRLHEILEPFMLRRQVEDVESKLPPKIPVVVKVAMSEYQSKIYNWVKATGTLRLDPTSPVRVQKKHSFAPLNNKVMELRKVCNHPFLSYPFQEYTGEGLVRQCGKLHVLDRLLIKLHHKKHRVLLFSTMTRLLDILESYLKWRRLENGDHMKFRRIDGGTTLEDRESAIKEFNKPNSEVFIFLLSIRAAGRGLNLQTADTVIIYDPDPNPKNEEQAIARAHRIGQHKEVRVVYLEAVADPLFEDDSREEALEGPQGSSSGAASARPPKQCYMDSIESLVRNTIQKQKIEMANEVIDAGRFDMRTTNEERKQTLENLLQDEDRFKNHKNEVPSLYELNRMIARDEEEAKEYDRLDRELQWPRSLLTAAESPPWVLFDEEKILEAIRVTSRHQKKAEEQVNLLGLSGRGKKRKKSEGAEEEEEEGAVLPRRRRRGGENALEGDTVETTTADQDGNEMEDDVTGGLVVGDDDDVEEVLSENIKMDMDDTGTTEVTGEGASCGQVVDGRWGLPSSEQQTVSMDNASNELPSGQTERKKDRGEEKEGRKKSKRPKHEGKNPSGEGTGQGGKKIGLKVRLKSSTKRS